MCNLAPKSERSEKPLRLTLSISMYATLTPTKVQALLSVSFRRSPLRFAPRCTRADN